MSTITTSSEIQNTDTNNSTANEVPAAGLSTTPRNINTNVSLASIPSTDLTTTDTFNVFDLSKIKEYLLNEIGNSSDEEDIDRSYITTINTPNSRGPFQNLAQKVTQIDSERDTNNNELELGLPSYVKAYLSQFSSTSEWVCSVIENHVPRMNDDKENRITTNTTREEIINELITTTEILFIGKGPYTSKLIDSKKRSPIPASSTTTHVLIKQVPLNLPSALSRFLEEVRCHDYVESVQKRNKSVKISPGYYGYYIDLSSKTGYIALEWIKGSEPIWNVVKVCGKNEWDLMMDLLGEKLGVLHGECGIVHGDLHEYNVLVVNNSDNNNSSNNNSNNEVLIIDYGRAWIVDSKDDKVMEVESQIDMDALDELRMLISYN